MLKGDSGIIGISENEPDFQLWSIANPEMARIINDIEVSLSQKKTYENRLNEQTLKTQRRFALNVQCMIDIKNELGNHFTDSSTDIFTLDIKVLMTEEVMKNMSNAEELGIKIQKFC